jgi:hypothetical protein
MQLPDARKSLAYRNKRTRHEIGERRDEQRQAEQHQQGDGGPATERIGLNGPIAADRDQHRHAGECHHHPGQHRQGALGERLSGAREYERQDRQDARADDGQQPAEKGDHEK